MEEFKWVNVMVIGIVALLLFLFFLGVSYRQSTESILDKSICKKSVQSNSNLRFSDIASNVEIKCPTLFIKVDSDDEKVVFENLALALADTWDEFLQGKSEIFETKTEDFCVIRRVVEFKQAKTYKGFFDYTVQHNPKQAKMSYFSYLTNVDVTKGEATLSRNLELRNADVIDTSKPYVAVLIFAKKQNIGKVLGAKAGAEIGAVTGIITAGGFILATGGTGALAGTQIVTGTTGLFTAVGALSGFMLGSSYPANWDAGMMLIPYTKENIDALDCTKLPVALTLNQ